MANMTLSAKLIAEMEKVLSMMDEEELNFVKCLVEYEMERKKILKARMVQKESP